LECRPGGIKFVGSMRERIGGGVDQQRGRGCCCLWGDGGGNSSEGWGLSDKNSAGGKVDGAGVGFLSGWVGPGVRVVEGAGAWRGLCGSVGEGGGGGVGCRGTVVFGSVCGF